MKTIAYKILIHQRGSKLPPGAVVIDTPLPETRGVPAGSLWSIVGTCIMIGLGWVVGIFALIASIFDWWVFIPTFFFLNLQLWVNWVGIFLVCIIDTIQIAVHYYNVNYTPMFEGIKGKYVLAAGGPYKWVRHPMYMTFCLYAIAIFLATEMWPSLLSVLCWGAVHTQAILEEDQMRQTFGEKYEHYYQSTGRFFPKLNRTNLTRKGPA